MSLLTLRPSKQGCQRSRPMRILGPMASESRALDGGAHRDEHQERSDRRHEEAASGEIPTAHLGNVEDRFKVHPCAPVCVGSSQHQDFAARAALWRHSASSAIRGLDMLSFEDEFLAYALAQAPPMLRQWRRDGLE